MRRRQHRLLLSSLAALCVAAAGACSSAPPPPVTDQAADEGAAGSGAGSIVWGKPADLIEYDPQTSPNGVSWQLMFLVYDTLVHTGDDLETLPGIAESWEQKSPTEYVFHLRDGVTFSNGRALDSSDVVSSFERLLDPELGASWTGQLGPVKSVTASDARTVTFTLSRPYTQFVASLANIATAILPIKELKAGTFDPTKELLGSGPYQVASHKQDQSWTFTRNPHYWRTGHPKLDQVDVRIIPDDTARIAALRSGAVDIANFENVDAPQLLSGVANVTSVVQDTTDYYRIDVNELGGKLVDQRVRQAINIAIDRDKIRTAALGGLGKVTAATPPGLPDSCDPDAIPSAKATLDDAKRLLKEAGAENLTFTLIASPIYPTFPLIAQVIQEDLGRIGVKVDIAQLDVGDWQKRVFTDKPGTFDAAMSYFAGYADPGMVISWWDPKKSVWNDGFLKRDADLVKLIEQSQTLPSGPERKAVLQRACDRIDSDAGIIPLVTRPVVVGYRTDRVNAEIQPNEGYLNLFRNIDEFSSAS